MVSKSKTKGIDKDKLWEEKRDERIILSREGACATVRVRMGCAIMRVGFIFGQLAHFPNSTEGTDQIYFLIENIVVDQTGLQ